MHETRPASPAAGSEPADGAQTSESTGAQGRAVGWRATLKAYVSLTKPRVIELLLVATIPTMILAQGGFPPFWLVIETLIGGYAAAGASGVFNALADRDIDAVMNRTKRRPLVTGAVSPRAATIFGVVLGVGSLVWFALLVNLLSALLTAVAMFIYVIVYTLILKRRTPQNIVWGGAAGCMPVLIGWAAVTNTVAWPAVLLFLVIFFWTPPHYWPLSIQFRRDYERAGVPMLPVVASQHRVAVEMIAYTVAMIAATLALWPVAGMTPFYGVSAILLGGWFLWTCIDLVLRIDHPTRGKANALSVFHGSITYLSLLFTVIAVDVFLPW